MAGDAEQESQPAKGGSGRAMPTTMKGNSLYDDCKSAVSAHALLRLAVIRLRPQSRPRPSATTGRAPA